MGNDIINMDLYKDIKSGSNLINGDEYRDTLLAVSKLASDIVVKTLGPFGKTTLIDDTNFAYPTKDGWSVLKLINFADPLYTALFGVLKQVSFSLVESVGDGTTSALIGANLFMNYIMEYQQTHEFRQTEFLESLTRIAGEITERINSDKYVHHIDPNGDFSDIERVALIASNGNKELSSMIKDIYTKTHNPNIYVTFDPTDKLSYSIQSGYKLDCRTINHKVYINDDSGICKKTTPVKVVIFDHNVTYNEHADIITSISRYANSINSEIILMAPHYDDIMTNIIGTSINSMLQRNMVPNIVMIQVPLSMEIHKDYLSDVVLLTNAQVFDYGKVRAFNVLLHNQTVEEKIEDALLNVDNYNFSEPKEIIETCIGTINNLVIADKYIVIQDYESVINKQQYDNTLNEVKATYLAAKEKANKNTTMLMKDYMDSYQRYTKLNGNLGIIKVGGGSELEKHCLKDAVDDAVLACRSAYDNGYIRGLNFVTISAIESLTDEYCKAGKGSDTNMDFSILRMLFHVFRDMSLCVLQNKYDDSAKRTVTYKAKTLGHIQSNGEFALVVKENVMHLTNPEILDYCIANDLSYNLVTETIESDSEATVINSVSTDIEILNSMISVLSIMLTSNQLLTLSRAYDRKLSRKQAVENKAEDQAVISRKIVESIVDVLMNKDVLLHAFLNPNSSEQEPTSRVKRFIKKVFKL